MLISKSHLKPLVFVLGALCALTACDRDVFEPSEDIAVAPPDADLSRAGNLKLMTRNLFVGAPVEMIYAPGANIPEAAAALWAWVQSTKFAEERAYAIADEIADAQPHVIGLQEVSVFTIIAPIPPQEPPLHCPPPTDPGPPSVETLDFLKVLQEKLLVRSLNYDVAAVQANFAGQVPMCDAKSVTGWSLVMLADFDAILVRGDLTAGEAQAATFETNLVVELAGIPLEIYRGWASVDVTVDGFPFRFVTTHLEPREPDPSIQVEQANELIETLTAGTFPGGQLPTIVTGDINSAPTDPGGFTPYRNFIKAGFKDVVGPIRAEATCCQDETLVQPSQLDRRVDVILFHGDFGRFPMFATVTGNQESDRTPSGLWPSDHAGVVAWKRLPPPFASP
jgi:endonuclease/exonuclease/phosphatase family metal-dependent hydrolase